MAAASASSAAAVAATQATKDRDPPYIDVSTTTGLYTAVRTLKAHLASSHTLPWPVPVALKVARALGGRLLRAVHPHQTQDDEDMDFVPSPSHPSPVWSPSLPLAVSTSVAGGTWLDVHTLYQHLSHSSRLFSNLDWNLALYAHHHHHHHMSSSFSSSWTTATQHTGNQRTLAKFLTTHFSLLPASYPSATSPSPIPPPDSRRRLARLAWSFPDTCSLAIYHLTLAHHATPNVHALLHSHMTAAAAGSLTDRTLHATAADRGIHALLIAQSHAGLPPESLLATLRAVLPWYAHVHAALDPVAPARALSLVLTLLVHRVPLASACPEAIRGTRPAINELLGHLSRHADQEAWPLAAYAALVHWACVSKDHATLVPLWLAQMPERATRDKAYVAQLEYYWHHVRPRQVQRDHGPAISSRPTPWWHHRPRASGHVDSDAELVAAFLHDPVLRGAHDTWALVIQDLVAAGALDLATRVFHQSVNEGHAAQAGVPALVQGLCCAAKYVDAVGVVATHAAAGAQDVLVAHAAQVRAALEEQQQEGEGLGGPTAWETLVAVAVDSDWATLLRALGVLDPPPAGARVPRVLVADLLLVLGRRGLVHEACAVVRGAGLGDDGDEWRMWVQAFERGADMAFGARAARRLRDELVGLVRGEQQS